jgi:hypothetical protein
MGSRVRCTAFWRQLRRATCADPRPRTPAHCPIEYALEFLCAPSRLRGLQSPLHLPAPLGADQQALPGVFIDQVQQAHAATIVRARADEIVRPDVIGVLDLAGEMHPFSLVDERLGIESPRGGSRFCEASRVSCRAGSLRSIALACGSRPKHESLSNSGTCYPVY